MDLNDNQIRRRRPSTLAEDFLPEDAVLLEQSNFDQPDPPVEFSYVADDRLQQETEHETLQEEPHLGERPLNGSVDLKRLKDSIEKILRQINEIAHKNVDIMFKSSVQDIEPCDEDPKFPYFELLKHLEKKYSDHEVKRFAKNLEEIVAKKELQRIITTLLVIFWVKVFCKINDDFPKKNGNDVLPIIISIHKRVLVNDNFHHQLNQHFPTNLMVSYLGIYFRWFYLKVYKNSQRSRRLYHKLRCFTRCCQLWWVFFFIHTAIFFFFMGTAFIFMKTILTYVKFQEWWNQ